MPHHGRTIAHCSRRTGGCGHKGDCTHDGTHATCPKCGNRWRHHLPEGYTPPGTPPKERYTLGPGTALKKTLRWFGIKETEGCGCGSKAATMNQRGPDWCAANIDEILGWLREAAEQRGMMFVEWIARLLVKRAIKKSRASKTP